MRSLVVVALAACGDTSGKYAPLVDAPPVDAYECSDDLPWAHRADLPLGPTQETAVVAAGGKIYVLGGFDANLAIIGKVQVFDPAICRWDMSPDLPNPVHHANAAVVGDTIYVLGSLQTSFTAIPNVWAWTIGAQTWTDRASMPAGTQRGASVTGVIDGKIYVAGGYRNGAVTDVSVYDPIANGWTALPALPVARDHGCGGVVGGKLYFIGGRPSGPASPQPQVYEYTPGGNWIERAPMPTGRGGTACGVVGNRIVVVGGEGNAAATSGVFPQSEAYDAIADTWESLAPMPTPRHGMGGAVVDGKLYVPGGANKQGFGAVATHEVLTP